VRPAWSHASDDVTPFQLAIPDAELDDLRARLRATRWPEPATDPAQGVGLHDLQALVAYWSGGHDWRRVEARLNEVGQFRTTIDGLGIHFLHARSSDPDALALVLTHGWPGSVVEFLDVISPLNEAGSIAWCPHCPATAGATSRPGPVGAWSESRVPGRR
jgi:epoxide hydrolase